MTIVFGGWGPHNLFAPGGDGVGRGESVDSFDYYQAKLGRPFGAHRWRGDYGQADSYIFKRLSDVTALARLGGIISTNLTPKYGVGSNRRMTYLQDWIDGHWDTAASIAAAPSRVSTIPGARSLTDQGNLLLQLQTLEPSAVVVVELWSEVSVQDPPPAAQPAGPDYTGARYQAWFKYVRDFWEGMGVRNTLYCLSNAGQSYAGTKPDEYYGTGANNMITLGYVDLVGIDAYSKPRTVGASGAKAMPDIAGEALAYAKRFNAKLYIPETGCEPGAGDGSSYGGVTYNTKADWFRIARQYLKDNASDIWGVTINYDTETTHYFEPEIQTGTTGSYTTDSWIRYREMAQDPVFAIGTPNLLPDGGGEPPPPPPPPAAGRTFDEWETYFGRGLEIQKFSAPTHTRTAINDFFVAGGEESVVQADTAPATPWGPRHVTPLRDIQMAGVTATGLYRAFNFGWANVVQNISPKAVTDPAGNAWSAFTETPQSWWTRQFQNLKNRGEPALVSIHANPERALAAQQASATAQALGSVTAQTFTDAFNQIVLWARAVNVPNLVGFVLWLDQETYVSTSGGQQWGDWANVLGGRYDFLGCNIQNPYRTTGSWSSFKSQFGAVHQKAVTANKPLILEVGSHSDAANSNRRALWFDEARDILAGDAAAYQITETTVDPVSGAITSTLVDVTVSSLDIEGMLITTTGGTDYQPDVLSGSSSSTTPDTATTATLDDVLDDPDFMPGGLTTTARTFAKSDAGVLTVERAEVKKAVSGLGYDTAGLYDSAVLYDGTPLNQTFVFAADSAVGSDSATPIGGVLKIASDAGSGIEQSVVARGSDRALSAFDVGSGLDAVGLLDKPGTQGLVAADSAVGTDYSNPLVITPDVVAPPVVADTFFIADPEDPNYPWNPTVPLVNLNVLPAGATTGWGLEAELSLGRVVQEVSILQQRPSQEIEIGQVTPQLVEMAIPIQGVFATKAQMQAAYYELAAACSRGGVIVYKERGSSVAYYIHFEPSDIPALYEGQERQMHKVGGLGLVLDLILPLRRQPRIFAQPIEGGVTTLRMRPGLRELRVTNPGNTDSPLKVRVQPQSGAQMVQYRVGVFKGDLDTFEAIYSGEIEGANLGAQTVSGTSASASGGTAAITTMTTQANGDLAQRWRKVISPPPPGTYRLYCTVNINGAVRVQARAGFVSATGSPTEGLRKPISLYPGASFPSSGQFVEIDLGVVRVPDDAQALVIEGWGGADDLDNIGSNLRLQWDQFVLMPVGKQLATVAVQGFRENEREQRNFTVEDNDIGWNGPAGTAKKRDGNSLIANEQNEVIFTKPSAGTALEGGRYRYTFHGRLEDQDHDATDVTYPPGRELARLEIWNLTQFPSVNLVTPLSSQTPVDMVYLGTKRNRRFTPFDANIEFTASAGSRYVALLRYLRPQNTGRRAFLSSISYSFLRTVTFPDQMILNAFDHTASIRTTNDDKLWSMATDGFIEVPKGESILVFSAWDSPLNRDYANIDEREVHGRILANQGFNVQLELLPAYVAHG